MRAHEPLWVALGGLLAFTLASGALADTVATFNDPAITSVTPLVTYERQGLDLYPGTLSASWELPGLDLIVPIAGRAFQDVHMYMPPVAVDADGIVSEGWIYFETARRTEVFTVHFDSAVMFWPFGFGACCLLDNAVDFSVEGQPLGLIEEMFAFSFANLVETPTGFTWTAAFTSSGIIPEPASLVLVGIGLCGVLRRR